MSPTSPARRSGRSKGQRAPKPRRKGARAFLWRWRRVVLALVLASVAFLGGLVLIVTSIELPAEPPQARTSFVVDAKSRPLGQFHGVENRIPVSLDEVAEAMRDAVLAVEDRSFYEHSGLDPRGIARALWSDLRGKPLQGGSTITQQLVKNSRLDPQRSMVRKLKEAVLAVKVEQTLSKDSIFERYLNTVYFGRGAYGVEAAARAYFGVAAADLEVHQAALLAGLVRAPERADPADHPDEARRRRNLTLDAMVETGALGKRAAERAKRAPLGALDRSALDDAPTDGARYVLEAVRRAVAGLYGDRLVYGGGLRIETTIDLELQRRAEQAVAEVLTEPDDPEAALVAVGPDGRVVAMVGGRDFERSEVNLALGAAGGGGGRQAGSAFKPFVLAAAVEEGIDLCTAYPAPSEVEIDLPGDQTWKVRNYGGKGYGRVDLARATAGSVNTVYAALIDEVGPEKVADVARRAGIRSELDPIHSLALGTEPVAPIEMAGAYLTFANRGERVDPHLVQRISDSGGDVIWEAPQRRDQAMEPVHADLVTAALRQVVEDGTGQAARIGRPVAGKTGTTQNYGDAWFVGYTPQLSTAVWMGYPEGQQRAMTDVHGRRVSGGSFPAQIWRQFMAAAVEGTEPADFTEPPPEARCRPSSTTTTTSAVPSTTTTTAAPTTTTTAATTAVPTTIPSPPTSTTSSPDPTTTTAGG